MLPKKVVGASRPSPAPSPAVSCRRGQGEDLEASLDFKPFERVEKLHPGELLELAPRLAAHVDGSATPTGATSLTPPEPTCGTNSASRRPFGASPAALVGRQMAVVTLAIVSTKPKEHFTRGAGGYFAAMVKRARTGELHLDRSLWKLRRDRWDRAPATPPTRAPRRPWA